MLHLEVFIRVLFLHHRFYFFLFGVLWFLFILRNLLIVYIQRTEFRLMCCLHTLSINVKPLVTLLEIFSGFNILLFLIKEFSFHLKQLKCDLFEPKPVFLLGHPMFNVFDELFEKSLIVFEHSFESIFVFLEAWENKFLLELIDINIGEAAKLAHNDCIAVNELPIHSLQRP